MQPSQLSSLYFKLYLRSQILYIYMIQCTYIAIRICDVIKRQNKQINNMEYSHFLNYCINELLGKFNRKTKSLRCQRDFCYCYFVLSITFLMLFFFYILMHLVEKTIGSLSLYNVPFKTHDVFASVIQILVDILYSLGLCLICRVELLLFSSRRQSSGTSTVHR